MNVILMSGGSGSRLWPLSNSVKSKQFLKVLPSSDGSFCSMVQRTYSQIVSAGICSLSTLVIATGENQVDELTSQLGDNINLAIEPERRDTMPAIFLACAYLHSCLGASDEEAVVVLPIDSYVEDAYYSQIKKMEGITASCDIALLGVKPTQPSSRFGYIIPDSSYSQYDGVNYGIPVRAFVEKPDEKNASEMIEKGALWNCGVFAFRLGYVVNLVRNALGTADYSDVRRRYSELNKTSFDYGVVEKTKSIKCLPYCGTWKDLGTWDVLTEELPADSVGNANLYGCSNTHVINTLNVPLVMLGVDNVVVCATADGILVSNKDSTSHIRDYLNDIQASQPMSLNFAWGHETIIKCGKEISDSSFKLIEINSGEILNQTTNRINRKVSFMVVVGRGSIELYGIRRRLKRGDSIAIPPRVDYCLSAETQMILVEI